MEGLRGPINPRLFGEEVLDVEESEQERGPWRFSCGHIVNPENFRFGDEEEEEQASRYLTTPGLEDERVPFLQMLQSVESPSFSPFPEPSFQVLLSLQHSQKRPWGQNQSYNYPDMEGSTNRTVQALEPESCVTNEAPETQSPAKSVTDGQRHHPHSAWRVDCNPEQPTSAGDSAVPLQPRSGYCRLSAFPPVNRERKKRKRTRPTKNKEEVENQRMTHIAVERNRRRQMNDHLSALRSLMPSSYAQRGDQASIIGGAIDYVKELEQLLQSLQAQKRMRKLAGRGGGEEATLATAFDGMFASSPAPPQYKIKPDVAGCGYEGGKTDDFSAESKSATAHVQARVIQNHVNLKIQCSRRPGQLLKAIVALEDLRLTILHLNITSLETSVLYSFNLKIEDDCKIGSVDEIVVAVDQIFSSINNG